MGYQGYPVNCDYNTDRVLIEGLNHLPCPYSSMKWVQVEYLGHDVECDYTADSVRRDALAYLVWHQSLIDLMS